MKIPHINIMEYGKNREVAYSQHFCLSWFKSGKVQNLHQEMTGYKNCIQFE